MKKTIRMAAYAALMLLLPLISSAQALPFTAAETDAVRLGTAGAGLASSGSVAYAAFGNPATLAFSEVRMDVAAGYTMWSPTSGSIINAGGAYRLSAKLAVAAGISYGMNPAYEITGPDGSSKGTFSPADMQIAAGVSYRILPWLSAGANIGYASSSLAEGHSYGAMTADVFVTGCFSGLKVALGVSNIGTSVTSASGASHQLPSSVAAGLDYSLAFADVHSLELMADMDYFLSGGIAAAAGLEYSFDGMVHARAGYRYGGDSPVPSFASVGAGVTFSGIKIDVAYLLGSEIMQNTIAVGLGYRF